MTKLKGILAQIVAYSAAILIAILVGKEFTHWHPLVIVAIADLAATITIFLFSLAFNNSSFYDPYWSLKPMVIAAYFFTLNPEPLEARTLLCGGLMLLYGIRLTSNFLRDWPGLQHEDWRYVNFRKQFPRLYWLVSFSGVHFFPTLMVYLACVPAYYAMVEQPMGLQWLDYAGGLVFLGSIVLSFVADEQMRSFRKKPENKGKLMKLGLWRKSRHPNYLGELLGWWGLWLFAMSASFAYYWTGLGALVITLLFVFISIPLMDKRSLERRPEYEEYMKKTAPIFPFGKKRQ